MVTVEVEISVATVMTIGLEGNWEMMVVICWDFMMISEQLMATSLLFRRDAFKDDILDFASSTTFLFFWRAEALMVISYSGLVFSQGREGGDVIDFFVCVCLNSFLSFVFDKVSKKKEK